MTSQPIPSKICTVCGQRKPWTDYWAAAKWDDGTMRRPQYRCKQCVKADRRARRRADPETWRQRDRDNWQALMANPERAARRRETQRENSMVFRVKQREQAARGNATQGLRERVLSRSKV